MNEDPAKARFMVLNLVRLTGAVIAGAGLAIVGGKLAAPTELGYALFAFGLFETLFMPAILARKWQSPPP
ncbi:MAG: hypothetical protein ACREBO_14235 [Novosphingobium sp.]